MNRILRRLDRSSFFRRLLRPVTFDITQRRAVFVLSCYNSGSTMLADVLGGLPGVEGLPAEADVLTSCLKRPEDYGCIRTPSLCYDELISSAKKLSERDAISVAKDWSRFLSRQSDCFLEKSISNWARADWLAEHFSKSSFVWIMRDPLCAAEGICRRINNAGHTSISNRLVDVELGIEQWLLINKKIREFAQRCPEIVVVKYEELSNNPSEQLKIISDKLNLQFSEKSLDGYKFEFHGESQGIRNMNEASLKRIDRDEEKKIRLYYREEFSSFGY